MGQYPRSLTTALAGALVLGAAGFGAVAAQTTRHVPEDFSTITEAIAASEKGDTILVGPGTYHESPVLTETKGNALIIRSTGGSTKTTIVYGEEENLNEAVVTFQRCSNSTQFVGFHIDGRGAARRGVLSSSDSRPVLVDITVEGCDLAFAAHRGARPYLRDVTAQNAVTAGLFISGGSADVRNALFTKAEKFGVYVASASEEVRLRDVRVIDNGQVGVQVAESVFSFEDGEISNNGDTGMILNSTSPLLKNLTITGHSNIGIVMEICNGTLDHCRIADNEYGAVSSIEGSPRIFNCVFENNKSYHVGIEGDARPLIGGSLEHANTFLGKPDARVQHSSTANVIATYNYWDLPCAPKKFFDIKGTGHLKRIPWASGNLLRSFDDCKLARKYNRWWKNGKLDDHGNHIKHKKLVPDQPADSPTAVEAASAGGAPPAPGGR